MATAFEYRDGHTVAARMTLAEWLALPIDSRRGTVAQGTAAMIVFLPPGVKARIPVWITPAAATTRRKRPTPANR